MTEPAAPAGPAAARASADVTPPALIEQLTRTSRFWRTWALRAWATVPVLTVALLVSVTFNVVQWAYQPAPAVVALDNENRVLPLDPLHQPVYSDEDVKRFAENAVLCGYSFSYINHQWAIDQCCVKYFTAKGCRAFRAAIERNKNAVVSARGSAGVALKAPSVFIGRYVDPQGRYVWQLEMLATVTVGNGARRLPQVEVIRIEVARRHVLAGSEGKGVTKYLSFIAQDQQS